MFSRKPRWVAMVKGEHSIVSPLHSSVAHTHALSCFQDAREALTLKKQVVFPALRLSPKALQPLSSPFLGWLLHLQLYLKTPVCVPRDSVPVRDGG